jgi:hypothetical protein
VFGLVDSRESSAAITSPTKVAVIAARTPTPDPPFGVVGVEPAVPFIAALTRGDLRAGALLMAASICSLPGLRILRRYSTSALDRFSY